MQMLLIYTLINHLRNTRYVRSSVSVVMVTDQLIDSYADCCSVLRRTACGEGQAQGSSYQ